jgi:hypothetical protein
VAAKGFLNLFHIIGQGIDDKLDVRSWECCLAWLVDGVQSHGHNRLLTFSRLSFFFQSEGMDGAREGRTGVEIVETLRIRIGSI